MMIMALKLKVTHAFASAILLWQTWNLHGFVLSSICLQFFLLFAAPFRKRTTNVILVVLVWCSYQLWKMVIDRSIGLVRSSDKQQDEAAQFTDLYALWAAFMILHNGGPDTITALAMEDNDLWLRSYVKIAFQIYNSAAAVAAVPYEMQQSRPSIRVSTWLILVAGAFKSFELINALTRSSFTISQMNLFSAVSDPGPDYAAAVEARNFFQKAGIPAKFVEIQPSPDSSVTRISTHGEETEKGSLETTVLVPLDDTQVVKQAYRLFNKFRGLYVEMVFCCHDWKESREYFLTLSSKDALRILETEMKFAYEALYTKTPVLDWKLLKYFRLLALSFEFVALFLWFFAHKNQFHAIDVLITSCLAVGAVSIEIICLIRIYSSDWKIGQSLTPCLIPKALNLVPMLPIKRLFLYLRCVRVFFRQWSESISQFNFINYCIDERNKFFDGLYSFFGAKDMMDGSRYVSTTSLTEDLREFIFKELREKSSMAENLDVAEEITSSRGSWVLRYNASKDLDPASFSQWITDVEFDESVMIWHIATELLYETQTVPENSDEGRYRKFSKCLSDYTLYLMIRQPKMMSEVAPMTEIIFKDTCEEAKHFSRAKKLPKVTPTAKSIVKWVLEPTERFLYRMMPNISTKWRCTGWIFASYIAKKKKMHKEACKRIMEVEIHISPCYIKEEENNSVLFDACELANKLKGMKNKHVGQWELTSKIWVELLCYAAAQSPAEVHTLQLSKGGELVTLVRLLMLHLGLSNQFQEAIRCQSPPMELVAGNGKA